MYPRSHVNDLLLLLWYVDSPYEWRARLSRASSREGETYPMADILRSPVRSTVVGSKQEAHITHRHC